MDKIQGYRKMLRTGDWVKFYPLFPLAGACLAAGITSELITVFALFFCITAYGFVINNLYDAEIDSKHSGKAETGKNPLADRVVSKKETIAMCGVLAGIPLLLSLAISGIGFVFTLLCLIALTLYSATPARLKDRFAADIICHGVMFGGLPFLTGYALAGGGIPELVSLPAAAALVCTFICCEALIAHEIMDYHEDLGTTYTTVVGIGLKNGALILGVSAMLSIITLELMAWWFTVDIVANAVILMFLIAYPLYSCRQILLPEAERGYCLFMNNRIFRTR
ncbi:UbiA prenyltransferase family protein [Methanogenium organophilum]|uniref:UbiA prenyltransferase family protein n=1 Tax=Methanogenium organophilum TaxID=2199 RepID=A0A9X9T797_METOG|nr:UbiA prenyltransferase family protein [Methanogenium organophilum]WAI00490.1 UbiA prenyltransferase family protein [Methanogenium organophilum]